jgi:hypothetical protein
MRNVILQSSVTTQVDPAKVLPGAFFPVGRKMSARPYDAVYEDHPAPDDVNVSMDGCEKADSYSTLLALKNAGASDTASVADKRESPIATTAFGNMMESCTGDGKDAKNTKRLKGIITHGVAFNIYQPSEEEGKDPYSTLPGDPLHQDPSNMEFCGSADMYNGDYIIVARKLEAIMEEPLKPRCGTRESSRATSPTDKRVKPKAPLAGTPGLQTYPEKKRKMGHFKKDGLALLTSVSLDSYDGFASGSSSLVASPVKAVNPDAQFSGFKKAKHGESVLHAGGLARASASTGSKSSTKKRAKIGESIDQEEAMHAANAATLAQQALANQQALTNSAMAAMLMCNPALAPYLYMPYAMPQIPGLPPNWQLLAAASQLSINALTGLPEGLGMDPTATAAATAAAAAATAAALVTPAGNNTPVSGLPGAGAGSDEKAFPGAALGTHAASALDSLAHVVLNSEAKDPMKMKKHMSPTLSSGSQTDSADSKKSSKRSVKKKLIGKVAANFFSDDDGVLDGLLSLSHSQDQMTRDDKHNVSVSAVSVVPRLASIDEYDEKK